MRRLMGLRLSKLMGLSATAFAYAAQTNGAAHSLIAVATPAYGMFQIVMPEKRCPSHAVNCELESEWISTSFFGLRRPTTENKDSESHIRGLSSLPFGFHTERAITALFQNSAVTDAPYVL